MMMASNLGMKSRGLLTLAEGDYRKRRQCDRTAVLAVVPRLRPRRYQPTVADIGSAEQLGVGVEDLLVEPLLGHPELVALPWHGGEVAAEQQEILRVVRAPQEGDGRAFPVVE